MTKGEAPLIIVRIVAAIYNINNANNGDYDYSVNHNSNFSE